MKKVYIVIAGLVITAGNLFSQNYHAIHGSSYAGSLGIANNPASIVNAPFPWDLTVFSTQLKNSTNAVKVLNYSLLSSPKNSKYLVNNGNYSRYSRTNFNIHLLNARLALNRRHSVGLGLNIRGYEHIKTGTYNFIDSVSSLKSFFKINEGSPIFDGDLKTSTWVEVFGTYSGTVWDRETDRLNAGITVKLNRGISGAFARLRNIMVEKNVQNNQTVYSVKSGNVNYGYSSNYDKWKDDKSSSENVKDFLVTSEGSFSLDVGIEYIMKSGAIATFHDEEGYFDYQWKIGLALLDIGRTNYKYGRYSRSVQNFQANISDAALQNKFKDIRSMQAFNDSLSTIVNNINPLSGKFDVINPARLVINIDRYLYDNFYFNGEMSINLSALAGDDKLYTSELNFITFTPRWETRRFGVYLPFQYNTEGQFWLGGAFKTGPLLIGLHNWSYIFAKNKVQNGGGYVALVIRPSNLTKPYWDKRNNCPPNK